MNQFINLNLHTDYSNATKIEIASTTEQYIELSKQSNNSAMAVTEHGNIFNWTNKKDMINAAGMKYIHGVEVFVTENFEEKLKDNYHVVLLAKNYDGVKEINRLVSSSFKGKGDKTVKDKHFYFVPRISFEQLANTSENIYILTACLKGALWQTYKANLSEDFDRWLDFFIKNRQRVWLEVQPHNTTEQKVYSELLKNIAKKYNFNMVATNDVHAHSKKADQIRKILMKGKDIQVEEYDSLELWWKTYDEMKRSFIEQGVFNEEEVDRLLNESVKIADSIEDFEFVRTPKYPRIFKNSSKEIQKHILEGYAERGIDQLSQEDQKVYQERIKHELKSMAKTDTIDYMMLEYTIKKAAREDNRFPGPGRGSAAGSLVGYLLHITDIDPIKHDLLFERFINPDRISIADIDSDYSEEDRAWIQTYLLTHDVLTCASIVTFGTLQTKSSFKELGRGMGYNFFELNKAVQDFEVIDHEDVIPESVKQKYPELCALVDEVKGIVVNVGRHAAAVIVSDRDLVSEIGVTEVKDFDYSVSTIDMSGVESLQYVKLDVLGLKNIEWIKKAAELAEIDRVHPDSKDIDFNDWNVLKEIQADNSAIFQFDSERTGKVVKELLSPTSLSRIKKSNPDIRVIDLLSVATAAIRPGMKSIVEDIMMGKPKQNGYDALNDMMADSFGYMIYQEQAIKFMTEFADMTGGQADTIRRAISKKKRKIIDHEVPIIKEKFIQHMHSRYGDSREQIEPIADEIMEIFLSSADYSFNKSHAVAYSYITFETAWLRTYYPLEYITAGLQIWKNDLAKTNRLIQLAKSKGISVKPPRFGYSKGDYFFDRSTNTIYQGTSHIKGCNATTGDLLFELKSKKIDFFVDLLLQLRDEALIIITVDKSKTEMTLLDVFQMSEQEVKDLDKDIKNDEKTGGGKFLISKSSLPINKTKMLALIRLNFFEKYGSSKKLEKVFLEFDKVYKPSNKTFKGKREKYLSLIEFEKSTPIDEYSIFEKCEFELFYTGQVSMINKEIPPRFAFVVSIENIGKTRTSAIVYSINKGIEIPVKVSSKIYKNVPFNAGDLIEIEETQTKPKPTKIDGVWTKHPTEKDLWLTSLTSIRKGVFEGK